MKITKWYDLRGALCFEKYILGSKLHRDENDGPAVVSYYEDGAVYSATYYRHGKKHRSDGPAHIVHSRDSEFPSLEMYYQHGLLHRDPRDGPAMIEQWATGVITESYFVHGHPYRDPSEGPHSYDLMPDGKIAEALYSPQRKLHRLRAKRLASSMAPK